MKKEDLLLTEEQMKKAYTSNIQGAFKFRNLADTASLKTAKFYESGISEIINNAKSSEDAIFKIGGFVYEAGKTIREIETEANYAKEK